MRIALTSEGTRGDIDPLLALAERFRERDHESLLCASPDFAQAAAEKQLEFQPIERSVRAFMREHADAVARGGVALLRSIRTYWTTALADQFEQLPKAARGSGLIIDAGVQAAAASTAEIYGIPYRYVVCCPSLLPSRCPVPFDQIPCLHAFDTHPLPAKREAFLDSGPPPIYLGFGSMTDPAPAATTRILLDAIEKVGCRALISEGWAALGAGPFPKA